MTTVVQPEDVQVRERAALASLLSLAARIMVEGDECALWDGKELAAGLLALYDVEHWEQAPPMGHWTQRGGTV